MFMGGGARPRRGAVVGRWLGGSEFTWGRVGRMAAGDRGGCVGGRVAERLREGPWRGFGEEDGLCQPVFAMIDAE